MAIRTAIYARVSQAEQAENGLSLGAQEDRCRAFAFAKGWDVVQVYVDGGHSGKSLDRPALQRLIADARAQVWSVVIVWKLDRLSRKQKDILYLLEDVLNPHGIGLQSATEPFDTTTPMGKAMLGMLAVFAQLERETIVERVKMGRAQSLKLGRWQGGKVPYGYQHSGRGQLTPDPVTAPLVRTLFERAAHGASPYQLATWLNSQGVEAPEGGQWWDRVVEKLLKNPVYHGYVGRTHPHPGHHPALVDEVTWQTVQRKFAGRQLGPHGARPDFWIDGLLQCPACGAPIRGLYARPTARGKVDRIQYDDPVRRYRFYYVCANRRRGRRPAALCDTPYHHAPAIHAQVLEQLRGWTVDSDALLAALQAEVGAPPTNTNDWEAQSAELAQRMSRWSDAFEQGVIDTQTLKTHLDQIRRQRIALEGARPPAPSPTPEASSLIAEAHTLVLNLASHWDSLTGTERQELLRRVIIGDTITQTGQVQLRFAPLTFHHPNRPPG